MSKRSVFTHISPLPPDISRRTAVAFLHDHKEMIEMNPLVLRHTPSSPPSNAGQDEMRNMTWYEITDEIQYIPGTGVKGEASYKAGFYNLPKGLQTHVFAPGGVDIHGKWSVGGNMLNEPKEPIELGITKPLDGLYIREDVDLRCNVFIANFVKRNLKKSHATATQKLIKRAREMERQNPQLRRPDSLHSASSETIVMQRNSLITSPVPYNQLYVPSGQNISRNPTPMSNLSSRSQTVCSCLGTRHHPACRYFIDIYQQPDNESLRSQTSPPTPSAQLERTGTSESDPVSAYSQSSDHSSCFCTGGVHQQGCTHYPGLRLVGRRSFTPLPQRDSQQAPYQLSWTLNDNGIITPDQERPSSRGASSITSFGSHKYGTTSGSPYTAYQDQKDRLDPDMMPQPLMTRTSHGHATPMELEGDSAVQRYYEYQAQRMAEME